MPLICKACVVGPRNCLRDYSFCGQLIKWDSGEYSMRLAYYRWRVVKTGGIWRRK